MKIGVTLPREELYARIDRRVDAMLEAGLEEEARRMLPYRSFNALQTVGYREFFDYFDGTVTRDEAITLIKRQHAGHFAIKFGARQNRMNRAFLVDLLLQCFKLKIHFLNKGARCLQLFPYKIPDVPLLLRQMRASKPIIVEINLFFHGAHLSLEGQRAGRVKSKDSL